MTQSLFGSRLFCLAVISMAIGLGSQAWGAMITLPFSGLVAEIFVTGPDTLDDEFSLGETVNIFLTYDPNTPETAGTAGDPNNSSYADPLISFSIDFVESSREFDMTGGPLQIINVLNDFNNAGIVVDNFGTAAIIPPINGAIGGSISGTINGVTPSIVSLSFVDFEFEPGVPDMFSDASLPAGPFEPDLAILVFTVNPGETVTVSVTIPEPGTLAAVMVPLVCFGAQRFRGRGVRV